MSFKKTGRLIEKMAVEVLTQFEHRGLANARHQKSGKIFGHSFGEGKTEQQQRDCFPGRQTGVRNNSLQTKKGLGALATFGRQSLIENWHHQRSNSDLE